MEEVKKFKLKIGYCHVLTDKIVLTKDGVLTDTSNLKGTNNIAVFLILYSAIGVYLGTIAYDFFVAKLIYQAIFISAMMSVIFFSVFKSINHSTTPIIERSKIKFIKFSKGFKGLTRSRFTITFENEKGRNKKRLLMMPGIKSNGEEHSQKAYNILLEEGLIVPEN